MIVRTIALLALLTLGCSDSKSCVVTGSVTLNGQPVQKGLMSLTPETGDGSTAGAPIVDGRYTLTILKPGRYLVHIAMEPDGPVILPNSPEARKTYTSEEIKRMSGEFPGDTQGNDVVIEIQAGEQVKDFPLTSASTRN